MTSNDRTLATQRNQASARTSRLGLRVVGLLALLVTSVSSGTAGAATSMSLLHASMFRPPRVAGLRLSIACLVPDGSRFTPTAAPGASLAAPTLVSQLALAPGLQLAVLPETLTLFGSTLFFLTSPEGSGVGRGQQMLVAAVGGAKTTATLGPLAGTLSVSAGALNLTGDSFAAADSVLVQPSLSLRATAGSLTLSGAASLQHLTAAYTTASYGGGVGFAPSSWLALKATLSGITVVGDGPTVAEITGQGNGTARTLVTAGAVVELALGPVQLGFKAGLPATAWSRTTKPDLLADLRLVW